MDPLICLLIFASLWSLRKDNPALFVTLYCVSLVVVLLWFRYHVTDALTLNF